ncbi:unnamed protein product [Durusdinium trenchii]|uniref:Uncharacterized protein n=1 Tax=Durusdinium trenchii TaxID=1381693 RepID=A0ABP0Q466_9DINO
MAFPLRQGTRSIVSRALGHGALQHLQEEVAGKFAQLASGKPPNISTAQLIQIFFELGLADVKRHQVGDVINDLMQHGFYCKTHPRKKDNCGPMPPPNVGLTEAQRWATLLFLRRLRANHAGPPAKGMPPRHLVPCAATWCQCPPGAAGTNSCAMQQFLKDFKKGAEE